MNGYKPDLNVLLQHVELPFKAAAASNVGTQFSAKDAAVAWEFLSTSRRLAAELIAQERNARRLLDLEVGVQSNLMERLIAAGEADPSLTVKSFIEEQVANTALSSRGRAA